MQHLLVASHVVPPLVEHTLSPALPRIMLLGRGQRRPMLRALVVVVVVVLVVVVVVAKVIVVVVTVVVAALSTTRQRVSRGNPAEPTVS